MRDYNHLHAAYTDTAVDPRLHGIARGLVHYCALPEHDDLPHDLSEALAKLTALADDYDKIGISHCTA